MKCKEQCSRRCEHQTCEKLCDEKCVGLPCSKNCALKLRCGHECKGICGEKCPQLCSNCHFLMFEGSLNELENDVRLVTLDKCGHTFTVDSLDLYMFHYSWRQNSSVSSEMLHCPVCPSTLTGTLRYKSVVEETRTDMETIKEEIKREDVSSMKEKLKYIKEKATVLKEEDSEAVSLIIKQLEEKDATPSERVNFVYGQMLILDIIYVIYQSILQSIIENTKEEKMIGEQLQRIRQWIFESVFIVTEKGKKIHKPRKRTCFSKQEILDVRLELWRLAYLVKVMISGTGLSDTKDKFRMQMIEILSEKSPISETKFKTIRSAAKIYGIVFDEQLFEDLLDYGVSKRYRIWQKGTWFKCKNGEYKFAQKYTLI